MSRFDPRDLTMAWTAAPGLILFDPLQLPAQRVAKHLLHLIAAHAGEPTIGRAQTLDCDVQSGRYKAGVVQIPGRYEIESGNGWPATMIFRRQ